jgi:hypothetical protein
MPRNLDEERAAWNRLPCRRHAWDGTRCVLCGRTQLDLIVEAFAEIGRTARLAGAAFIDAYNNARRSTPEEAE